MSLGTQANRDAEKRSDPPIVVAPVADGRNLMSLYAARLASTETLRAQSRLIPQPALTPIMFGRALSQRAASAVSVGPPEQETERAPVRAPIDPPRRWTRPRFHVPFRGFHPVGGLRRLVTAAFVVTIILAGSGQGTLAQQRYVVQPGDTLQSVAAQFGVDPDAILRASWVADPPNLQPGEVIVIPDPGQTPDEAAAEAAAVEGTSPWVAGAYWVESGDTIEGIAAMFGVDLQTLIDLNELENPDLLQIGQRILIPAAIDGDTGEPVALSDPNSFAGGIPGRNATSFVWVPTHLQERNLSCEYASAYIATSAVGDGIPEWVFIESVPPAQNPHYGYRGDIDGRWGNYDDYGVYPEPLVPILNDYGFIGEVFYGESDPSLLIAHLDAGHPVVVWLALWGDTGVVFEDDGRYTVFAGMHVMVAYAYDDQGVYLSDPGIGGYRFYSWETFMWMWSTTDGMSLAVYPA
jgi:LysM repeat protein/uncharacterized protein YvpB